MPAFSQACCSVHYVCLAFGINFLTFIQRLFSIHLRFSFNLDFCVCHVTHSSSPQSSSTTCLMLYTISLELAKLSAAQLPPLPPPIPSSLSPIPLFIKWPLGVCIEIG